MVISTEDAFYDWGQATRGMNQYVEKLLFVIDVVNCLLLSVLYSSYNAYIVAIQKLLRKCRCQGVALPGWLFQIAFSFHALPVQSYCVCS